LKEMKNNCQFVGLVRETQTPRKEQAG